MNLPAVPNFGTHTHPLSAVAREALDRISRRPLPTQEFNPGIVNRLGREVLVELVSLPSPYVTHKGKRIPHLMITEAGKAVLATKRRASP